MDQNGNTADSGFDIEAGVASIASDLGFGKTQEDNTSEAPIESAPEAPPETGEETSPQVKSPRPPPQSWAKDKHQIWAALPPEAQEYYELREKQFLDGLTQYKTQAELAKKFQEIVSPYADTLRTQGVSELEAIQYLLNAHQKLTTGSEAERRQIYEQLGRDLGLLQQAEQNQQVDPVLQQLQNEIRELKSARQQELMRAQQAAREEAEKAVQAFAADPAHPYCDEVATEMAMFVSQGMDLKEAYERAVWANPVTRQKEMARLQTEQEAKLKEAAKAKAEAARRTASAAFRGTETQKEPTEPKGSIEDTLRDTLQRIRNRT